MRKIKIHFVRVQKFSLYLFFLTSSVYLLNACTKTETQTHTENPTVVNTKKSLDSLGNVRLYMYPGACPYPCGDSRCNAYEIPNANCTTTTDTIALIRNSNNPKESVGQSHNDALRSIMPYYSTGLEPTQANVHSYTRSYLIKNGYDSGAIERSYNYTIQHGYYRFPKVPSIDSVTILLVRDGNFRTTAKNYSTRLSSLVKALDGAAAPTSTTYSSFANQCIIYENQIKNDATLNSTEKDALLIAHSIARFSLNYWINYYNNQSTSTTTVQAQILQQQQTGGGWFNWKDAVGDDVAGAVGGAAAGAIAGAIAGGITAGPAALGGGAGGCVGASLQNATKQIWNHFFS